MTVAKHVLASYALPQLAFQLFTGIAACLHKNYCPKITNLIFKYIFKYNYSVLL